MIDAARRSLGDLFAGIDARVGDAGQMPFNDGEFDLLVSTRFLRDIVTFGAAKRILTEFARITSGYAIIQLGQSDFGNVVPDDNETMAGVMSAAALDQLLADHGFRVMERRLVNDHDGGKIHHILCQRT